MTVQTQVTDEELRRVFADTLDKGASHSAIFVAYDDGGRLPRIVLGVPYDIMGDVLEIGPYFKNIVTSRPKDYGNRKMQIPIKDIVKYKRIELSDIL